MSILSLGKLYQICARKKINQEKGVKENSNN